MSDDQPLIDRTKTLLRQEEGLRLKPYYDTARPPRLTIGYGRNLSDRGITVDEAEMLLEHDILNGLDELRHRWRWFDELGIVRQAVLLDLHFNLGLFGLSKFNRFLHALQQRDYQTASDELLDSEAAQKLPTRYARLALMVRTGEWLGPKAATT